MSIFYNPSVNPAGSGVNNTSYVNPVEDFSGNVTGGGTLTAYMLVNTVYDLQNIKNNLSGNYALGKDIDASETASWNSGAGFVPLSPFSGILTGQNSNTFDGNNYTITGLTINAGSTPSAFVGLFNFISNSGVVRNVNLANFAFIANGPNSRIGFLAAVNTGTVTQVSATGSFNTTSDGVMFGGLVASNFVGGTIIGSSANVHFTGTGSTLSAGVGGLVGQNIGTISQSFAAGNVSGIGRVGGLVGFNSGTISQSYATGQTDSTGGGAGVGGLVGQNNATITQSYATGQVGVPSHPVVSAGGLAGINSGTISESYATGLVAPGGGFGLGGLVGAASGTTNTSYWDTQTSGRSTSAGGTGLTTVQLTSGLPSGFDQSVWGSSAAINSGYPYLLWTTVAPPPPPTILTPSVSPPPPPPAPLPNPGPTATSPAGQQSVVILPSGFPPFPNQQISQVWQPPTWQTGIVTVQNSQLYPFIWVGDQFLSAPQRTELQRRHEIALQYAFDNAVFQTALSDFLAKTIAAAGYGEIGAYIVGLEIKVRDAWRANEELNRIEAANDTARLFLQLFIETFGPVWVSYPLDMAKILTAFTTAYAYGFVWGQ